jgi:hypothetical protein
VFSGEFPNPVALTPNSKCIVGSMQIPFPPSDSQKESIDMAKGDLISIRCYWGIVPYRHYGIDMGDGTAVHLATDSGIDQRSMSVQRVPLKEFAAGEEVRFETSESSLPAELVVARAAELVGQREYHFLFGNCEHFARDCKYGRKESIQVNRVAASVISASVACITLAQWHLKYRGRR